VSNFIVPVLYALICRILDGRQEDKKSIVNGMVASIPQNYVHENVNFGTVLKYLLISLMLQFCPEF
jgi:hypothetical protein